MNLFLPLNNVLILEHLLVDQSWSTNNTLPMMSLLGIGPWCLESWETFRLSPSSQKWRFGTVALGDEDTCYPPTWVILWHILIEKLYGWYATTISPTLILFLKSLWYTFSIITIELDLIVGYIDLPTTKSMDMIEWMRQ
jgi:hypothetical protein